METPVIYINEHPLLFTGLHTSLPPAFTGAATLISPPEDQIRQTLGLLENDALPMAVIRHTDPVEMFGIAKRQYIIYEAAGGLITNPAGEVLIMFRRGKWDLPKGKLDEGEDLETCALREVQEETGLHNVSIANRLTETWHYYAHKGKKILKHSHWYRMYFTGTELTVAQIEEDIVDIQWIRPENLSKYLAYSYENIRDVFRRAGYNIES
ncbi:NUDIX hydrolase [Chitinophaga lutea]